MLPDALDRTKELSLIKIATRFHVCLILPATHGYQAELVGLISASIALKYERRVSGSALSLSDYVLGIEAIAYR